MLGPAIVSKILVENELEPEYICPSCKTGYSKYFYGSYCRKCGAKLEKNNNLKSKYFCDFCHKKISPKDKFCIYCGREIKKGVI